MKIAIVLYDRFTVLDAIGPYQVFTELPGASVVLAAADAGLVADEHRLMSVQAPVSLAEITDPDVVIVPGGPGQRDQMSDGPLHEWLRAVDKTSTWTTSVCTGSLVLAAAGLLTGRRATTYWMARERLAGLGVTVTDERVVFDGKYVTAAGVSAGIEMALTLAGVIAGERAAQAIQLGIEYDPRPPYDSGSPDKAPKAIVDLLWSRTAS